MPGQTAILVIVLLLAVAVIFAYFYMKRAQARGSQASKSTRSDAASEDSNAPL